MKKAITVFLITLLGFSFSASAQYEKGQKDLNIGVGLLSTFGAGKQHCLRFRHLWTMELPITSV